jgi:hypothetical protein
MSEIGQVRSRFFGGTKRTYREGCKIPLCSLTVILSSFPYLATIGSG